MPIVISKQKQKVVAPKVDEPVQDLLDCESLTDELLADKYAALKVKVDELKKHPAVTQFAEVEKELYRRLKEELKPTEDTEIVGERWLLEIAPCNRNPRRIDQTKMPKLATTLGIDLFYKLAKLTMKDMEQYVGKAIIEQFLETDTGYSETRKITIKKRA